jgi:hypothetical protein
MRRCGMAEVFNAGVDCFSVLDDDRREREGERWLTPVMGWVRLVPGFVLMQKL